MSLFGSIIRTAVDVVSLPVAVAADVFTGGGTANERSDPYTKAAVKKIAEDVKDASDAIDDEDWI